MYSQLILEWTSTTVTCLAFLLLSSSVHDVSSQRPLKGIFRRRSPLQAHNQHHPLSSMMTASAPPITSPFSTLIPLGGLNGGIHPLESYADYFILHRRLTRVYRRHFKRLYRRMLRKIRKTNHHHSPLNPFSLLEESSSAQDVASPLIGSHQQQLHQTVIHHHLHHFLSGDHKRPARPSSPLHPLRIHTRRPFHG